MEFHDNSPTGSSTSCNNNEEVEENCTTGVTKNIQNKLTELTEVILTPEIVNTENYGSGNSDTRVEQLSSNSEFLNEEMEITNIDVNEFLQIEMINVNNSDSEANDISSQNVTSLEEQRISNPSDHTFVNCEVFNNNIVTTGPNCNV